MLWSKRFVLFLTNTDLFSFYGALVLPMHHHVESSSHQIGRKCTSECLDPLPALPSVSCLQSVPIDTSCLHTYEPLIRILRCQVRHRPRFFDPWVPNYHIRQHIPGELESRLVLLRDGDPLRWVYVVDAIDLRRDGDSSRFFLLSTTYFVCEGDLFEPGD